MKDRRPISLQGNSRRGLEKNHQFYAALWQLCPGEKHAALRGEGNMVSLTPSPHSVTSEVRGLQPEPKLDHIWISVSKAPTFITSDWKVHSFETHYWALSMNRYCRITENHQQMGWGLSWGTETSSRQGPALMELTVWWSVMDGAISPHIQIYMLKAESPVWLYLEIRPLLN